MVSHIFLGVKPFSGSFKGKDVIFVEQFSSRKEIDFLFSLADEMKISVTRGLSRQELKNSTVALLFYQPSTRTYTSFQAASQWLGCRRIVGIPGMEAYSSAVKGESLQDTVRTIEQTTAADLIILRHPEDNSSAKAARFAKVPIINAGSGRLAHPTQAILDLYTLREELGRMEDLEITMIGDLKNGRTIKSLSQLLALVGKKIKINFISPQALKMPREMVRLLKTKRVKIFEGNSKEFKQVLPKTDVLYVTRIQKEWFVKQALEIIKVTLTKKTKDLKEETLMPLASEMGEKQYQQAVCGYVIDRETLRLGKKGMIVMHPLPRVGEIAYEVDKNPHASYFRQMRNGLYTRMALLKAVLEK